MLATGRFIRENGFTLIEALVVVAIVALISGIGYPSLRSAIRSQEFSAGQSSVLLALKETRASAIRGGRVSRFSVLPGGHGTSVNGINQPPLADANRLVSLQNRSITFYSDGTSNGGQLTLTSHNRHTEFTIYPTTGFIAVSLK